MWFVPESPRWYISKGQHERALSVLAKVHAEGNADDEVVQLEYEEVKETLLIEKEAETTGWLELFRTKGNRHRLLILISAGLFSQWSGNGLVSYYITGVLDTIGIKDPDMQLKINGCLNIWNCLVATTMCFFVEKIGRRPLFLISTAGMCGSFVVWTICSERFDATQVKANGSAVVFMIFLYYTFYNVAWSGLLVGYTVEILPFSIRAKGMCYMFAFVDVALFFNTYVNPIALDHIKWKYYIVYVSHLLCRHLIRLLIMTSAPGSQPNWSSSTSSTSRPRTRRSRKSPATSTATPRWSVARLRPRRAASSSTRSTRRSTRPPPLRSRRSTLAPRSKCDTVFGVYDKRAGVSVSRRNSFVAWMECCVYPFNAVL